MSVNFFNIVYECLANEPDFVASMLSSSNNQLIGLQLKNHPSANIFVRDRNSAVREIERLRKLMLTDNDSFLREARDILGYDGLCEMCRHKAPEMYDSAKDFLDYCEDSGLDWCYFFKNCIPFTIRVSEIEIVETEKRKGRPKTNKYSASLVYDRKVVPIQFKPQELAIFLYFVTDTLDSADKDSSAQFISAVKTIMKRLTSRTHEINDSRDKIRKAISDTNSKIIDAISKHGVTDDNEDADNILRWYTINTTKDYQSYYKLSLPKECISLPPELKKDSL